MGSVPISAPKLSTGYLERRSLVVGATLPIFIDYPSGLKLRLVVEVADSTWGS